MSNNPTIGSKMKIYIIPLLILLLPATAIADSNDYGNSIQPIGPSQQISATTTSGTVTLSPSSSNYVYVLNEGSNTAYIVCASSAVATVPGGSGPNSTPVPPNGGGAIIQKGLGIATCAAITASSTSVVDFTPVNLY